MNKRIFIAAIRIVPKRLQEKALSKALNFLFLERPLQVEDGTTLKLQISELKFDWLLTIKNSRLLPLAKIAQPEADIIVSSDLDTVLSLQDKNALNQAISTKKVTVDGKHKEAFLLSVAALSQQTIDQLTRGGYRFLRLKQPPRLNINTVTFADIKNQRDVDFLRDEAIRVEQKDLKLALRLMEIAHKARPNGPLIRKKVQQYRSKMQNHSTL